MDEISLTDKDFYILSNNGFQGYHRYKTILCHNVQLMNFFI